ncbi:hypothetical protein D3C85_632210 [compost metagenome]
MSEIVTSWILGIAWLAGAVLAKGFWSTVFAVTVPFWAWYLVIERALAALGWMP